MLSPKNYLLVLFFTLIIFNCNSGTKYQNLVDPFIGTEGDHGHFTPAASLPFGMLQLGPDTYPSSLTGDGDFAHSGYNYSDNKIRGFSHIRKSTSGGVRICDRSWLLSVLPVIGTVPLSNDSLFTGIDKKSEFASPGQYQVYLNDYNIQADLTVSPHAGFHRYCFPESNNSHIVFNLANSKANKPFLNILSSKELTGSIKTSGHLYFYAKFSKPFTSFSIYDDKIKVDGNKVNGKKILAVFDFQTKKDEIVYIKVGLSATCIEQARLNLEKEIPEWDFDGTVKQAEKQWDEIFKKIKVEGDPELQKIFYTALFHTYTHPNNVTDVNGIYPGYDKKNHVADGYIHYENYAFWDSYRTKYPLLSLIDPKAMKDIVRSIVDIYEQSADYWTFPNIDHKPHGAGFDCMGPDGYVPYLNVRNEHMLTVVLDAYTKGLLNSDLEKAYDGMRKEIMLQMPEKYDKIGYIPARPDQTCEYCYDNWCVAQMVIALGKQDDYDYFIKRSQFYHNTWDKNIEFFRAKSEKGEWLDFPESPDINREKYMYEGTPWQWRWFVPHNGPGLVNLIGGKEKFSAELDYFFNNDLYTQGNQPDVQAPFLFNSVGTPWLTQKWVRKILVEPMTQRYGTHGFFEKPFYDRIFKTTPDGYLEEMDDDYGCMAAWFVMSAMGLYQVCPGEPIYQVTAPIFDRVTLNFDENYYTGKEFTIIANNLTPENIYIQSATLNNKPFNRTFLKHDEIVCGGKLVFNMGPEPNKNWGVSE